MRQFGISVLAVWTMLSVPAVCNPCFAQAGPGGRSPITSDPLPEIRPPSDVEIKPFARPVPDGSAIQKVKVARFRFTGLTTFDASELQPVVSEWMGRELSSAELEGVLHAVTKYLRERGLFVAQAYLPDQQVTEGVVEIAVLEGRLGAVNLEMDPDSRLARRTAEGFLSGLQSGTLISRGKFDTSLLLLNDLPGVRVTPRLPPGSALGTADLHVSVADEPIVAGFLRLDNHEIPEVGRYDITAHLRLRNAAGIGDLATGEFKSTHTGDRKRATFSYSVPINHAGTRVAFVVGGQRYVLKGNFEQLRANGDYDRATVAATHAFLRTHDANVFGDMSISQDYFRDRIDAFGLATSARHRYVTGRLRGDRADGVLGGGRSAIYAEFQTGRVDLDAQEAVFDALGLRVQGEFTRWRAGAQRIQSTSGGSELSATFFTQLASKNLAPGREFQLGGPEGIRAYPSGEMYPDEGYIIKVDYRHRLFSRDGWRAIGGVFWDSGRGKLNRDPLPGALNNARTLSGSGLSLLIVRVNSFEANVTMAWRTTGTPQFDRDLHPRIWFSTTAYF